MAISKIILNGTTQMDVTGVTATPADVAYGKTFIKSDGTIGTGEADMSVWTTLYEGTTTEESILQILVDNISVKEVEVWIYTPAYSSSYWYYIPLMQTTATHYDKAGYLRMMVEKGSSTTGRYISWVKFLPVVKNQSGTFLSNTVITGSQSSVQCKSQYDELSNMTVGMTITSLAVATYVNTPAGTTIIVRGK